ncbi:acetyltransferase [Niveomyces insectorum RCEF 264]|uniref:Acetyltransferase n=1 Tax=Niveomyces insectorum RCEF 264 TaxID=1081102 RepID=A0A167PDM4_9HYPO|nr:acetyltransferase [Niveomyces insectorum RCEF 264]
MTAFIRPYKPSDWDNTAYICRATLPPSLQASEPAIRLAPYIWTHPFTVLSPACCFVVDDGDGRAVGYIVGTPDVHRMAAVYGRYVAVLTGKEEEEEEEAADDDGDSGGGITVVPAAARAQARQDRALVAADAQPVAYTAMLHINLLPGYQAAGWGRKLITTYLAAAARAGARGVHLGVSGENTKVVPFYERMGFRVTPGGEGEGNVWMVREVEPAPE